MPFRIRLLPPDSLTVEARRGQALSGALADAGLPLDLYCGSRGLCGRCLVEVVEGLLPAPDADEQALLHARGAPRGARLACRIEVESDLVLRIPPLARLAGIQGLTEGMIAPFPFDPPVKRLTFRLEGAEAAPPLLELRAAERLRLRLDDAARRDLGTVLRESVSGPGIFSASVFDDGLLLDIRAAGRDGPAFGLAVDLGTTAVAVELIDLSHGRIAARALGLNRQARYGADLISRLAHAVQAPNGGEELRRAARETLSELMARACSQAGVSSDAVYDVVVSGNTVMNHLLLGRPVRSLAEAPFEPDFLSLAPLDARACGLDVQPRARLFISPNIGSYVGGDITSGLVAAGLLGRPGRALFIDLGTNGEIVLKAGDKVTAASTAAGPAFEGAGLSCGRLAVPGAVDGAAWSGASLSVSVIGGPPAAGICGTGYIDLLAGFLRGGLVSPRGALTGGAETLPVAPGVTVSRQDVRALQLAVAAVRTGVALLLRREGLGADDLDAVYLAGAFGSKLNAANARRIGLLPPVAADKVRFVGNTSLSGARAMLLSRAARSEAAAIAERVEHVPLASDASFQDTYIRSLAFPEDGDLDALG